MSATPEPREPLMRAGRWWPWVIVAASALLGLALIADEAFHLSSTYDEATYFAVGARWWRTGEQESITRMGSPLTFWKLQQTPVWWGIDHFGPPEWRENSTEQEAAILPWLRLGGVWLWLASLGVVAIWARSWYGARAMALAAVLFTLSPNLLAHGALATMEIPLVATSSAMFALFARFLGTGRRRDFWLAAIFGGLAFSCKFTTVLMPPILAVIWAIDLTLRRDRGVSAARTLIRICGTVGLGMIRFGLILLLADFVVTGCALLPLSPRSGSHPTLDRFGPRVARVAGAILEGSYPQDWVGFATQMIYQREGGPSYLLGERRMTGWWYYYPVALAVKVPLAVGLLVLVRAWVRPVRDSTGSRDRRDWIVPVAVGLFLLAAVAMSKRNYGVRYLLPLAPLAIVWVSALANARGKVRWLIGLGVVGMALPVGSVHPYELSYFNVAAGGPIGGRRILSDSNLDWGQGAKGVATLQGERPEYADLTWYYFGDKDPGDFGVVGRCFRINAQGSPSDLPPNIAAQTRYLAVSASLQWGPWGPAGYFREFDELRPVCYSPDWTVAIYRTADLAELRARTGRDRD